MTRRRIRRGSATLEFTLVGIPLMFALISIVEMARGMWTYHSLAHAVKEGTRYAVVHGQDAGLTPPAMHGTYQSVCNAIVNAAPGLVAPSLTLYFKSLSGTQGPFAGDACLQNTAVWPPGNGKLDKNGNLIIDDQPGQTITIYGYYPFVSALSMLWPGGGSGVNFVQLTCTGGSTLCLPASSSDMMQF